MPGAVGKGGRERIVPWDRAFFECAAYVRTERPPGCPTPECVVVLLGPTSSAPQRGRAGKAVSDAQSSPASPTIPRPPTGALEVVSGTALIPPLMSGVRMTSWPSPLPFLSLTTTMASVDSRRMLESDGFTVAEASTGAEATEVVSLVRPRLVLLDIQLPDSNGFEVARRLAAQDHPAIIVLTSTREASDYGSQIAQSAAVASCRRSSCQVPH
jgi:hypothetical protein